MATLEKRIEALEQASNTNTDNVIFIHFVGMGEVNAQIQRITHEGQEWQRQPDESERDLKDRALQDAKSKPHQALMLYCY